MIVRHLPLADNIVVLDADGHVAEQGTFEHLRAQEGFVSNVLLASNSKIDGEKGEGAPKEKKPSAAVKRALKGPTANDFQDLTRRTGDISVYKYYLASIGWNNAVATVAMACIYSVTTRFNRKWPPFPSSLSYSDAYKLCRSPTKMVYRWQHSKPCSLHKCLCRHRTDIDCHGIQLIGVCPTRRPGPKRVN